METSNWNQERGDFHEAGNIAMDPPDLSAATKIDLGDRPSMIA